MLTTAGAAAPGRPAHGQWHPLGGDPEPSVKFAGDNPGTRESHPNQSASLTPWVTRWVSKC